jgi:hypothetical protein
MLQVRFAAVPVPQQGWPMAPQAWQVSAPPPAGSAHTKPIPQPLPVPGQHGWLAPPHAAHIPGIMSVAPVQDPPGWQVWPGQQAAPTAPQFIQVFGAVPGGLAQPSPV